MGSKKPPKENMTAETPSQSSPILTPHEGRDDSTPAQIIENGKDSHSSSGNNSFNCSDTDTSKPTMVPVSGSPRDIICGRGLHIMNHHGNHNLHLLVDRHRQSYLTSTRREKAAITQHLVQQLKSTGARFLRRFNDDSDDKWVIVDDKTAYKKVSHALRLRKSDHGRNFLQSVDHRQQVDSEHSLPLHSTSPREIRTSQDFAAMPIIRAQNIISHPALLPASSSLAAQLPPLAPSANQLQVMATQSALPLAVLRRHSQPILHPSVANGYSNMTIDPRLFADAFAITLATVTQLQHQQRSSFHTSSADSRRSEESSREERKFNR
ncbi:unnamed protein product [Cylindrotheca closterium]|uniref:DUF6824 domain-containing protein n=1 Tax=Cylindrotheca closterium TaxID=2856 RepID=A0AAD2FS29_9STRA|nr:unnamed protein product [Cylindrotheca closterium]